MDERKDGMIRRQITFHSLRRFVKSTISDYDSNFSEWLLGHQHSPYWTKKPEVKRQKYLECMKYLQFLDYEPLEQRGKAIESQLQQKDQQINELSKKIAMLEAKAVDEEYVTSLAKRLEALEKKGLLK